MWGGKKHANNQTELQQNREVEHLCQCQLTVISAPFISLFLSSHSNTCYDRHRSKWWATLHLKRPGPYEKNAQRWTELIWLFKAATLSFLAYITVQHVSPALPQQTGKFWMQNKMQKWKFASTVGDSFNWGQQRHQSSLWTLFNSGGLAVSSASCLTVNSNSEQVKHVLTEAERRGTWM